MPFQNVFCVTCDADNGYSDADVFIIEPQNLFEVFLGIIGTLSEHYECFCSGILEHQILSGSADTAMCV